MKCVVSLSLTPEKWEMLEWSCGGNGNCSCRTTSWTTIRISHGKWGRSRHALCTMHMGIGLQLWHSVLPVGIRYESIWFHVISLLPAKVVALPSQVAQADDFGDSDFAGYQAHRLTSDNCYHSDTSWYQYFVDLAFWYIYICIDV